MVGHSPRQHRMSLDGQPGTIQLVQKTQDSQSPMDVDRMQVAQGREVGKQKNTTWKIGSLFLQTRC